mmetsp:Transcript_9277/g.14785  ORF Transcript_9277/g.14785 Transcript_9277/m.14785 type:complete len:226 (-) Transcript_9277:118-795(-)
MGKVDVVEVADELRRVVGGELLKEHTVLDARAVRSWRLHPVRLCEPRNVLCQRGRTLQPCVDEGCVDGAVARRHDLLHGVVQRLGLHEELEIALLGGLPDPHGLRLWLGRALALLWRLLASVQFHGHEAHLFHEPLVFSRAPRAAAVTVAVSATAGLGGGAASRRFGPGVRVSPGDDTVANPAAPILAFVAGGWGGGERAGGAALGRAALNERTGGGEGGGESGH